MTDDLLVVEPAQPEDTESAALVQMALNAMWLKHFGEPGLPDDSLDLTTSQRRHRHTMNTIILLVLKDGIPSRTVEEERDRLREKLKAVAQALKESNRALRAAVEAVGVAVRDERETCAQLCEDVAQEYDHMAGATKEQPHVARQLARFIRQRGKKP